MMMTTSNSGYLKQTIMDGKVLCFVKMFSIKVSAVNLLKVKTFHDAEYEVIDTEMGMFPLTLNGKECEEEMLSCVYIKHKDNVVRVGSGFTIEQRQYFYNNPDAILGKIITVQYFEETKNQEGGISLRFPTFKVLHGVGLV